MKKIIFYLLLLSLVVLFPFLNKGIKSNSYKNELLGVKYVVRKNDNIIGILKSAGLSKAVMDSVIHHLSRHVNISMCRPDEEILIFTNANLDFRKLEYKKNQTDIFIVEIKNNAYTSKRKDPDFQISIDFIECQITSNIFNAIINVGEKPELVEKFIKIFAWEFDFNSDVRKGDRMDVLVEKIFINGEFYTYGKILYAAYETKTRFYEAFYFKDDKREGYFDKHGKSLERNIMKAPIAFYTRISSGYTNKRYHPVLKKYLPHHAIDYAAPRGTPVYAAGDGIIVEKKYERYGGRVLRIKHNNGYETEYMHLNSYSSRAKLNKFIKQGEIIGYVGRTGLATGHHLHYAVKKNGKYINPRKMNFERVNVFSEDEIAYFDSYKNVILDFVFAARSFIQFPNYSSKSRYLFEYAHIIDKSPGL